jgi:hypothetical protein
VQEVALVLLVAVQTPEVPMFELDFVMLVELAHLPIGGLVLVAVLAREVLVVDGWGRQQHRLRLGPERTTRVGTCTAPERSAGHAQRDDAYDYSSHDQPHHRLP